LIFIAETHVYTKPLMQNHRLLLSNVCSVFTDMNLSLMTWN